MRNLCKSSLYFFLLSCTYCEGSTHADYWCWGESQARTTEDDGDNPIELLRNVNLQLLIQWNGDSYKLIHTTSEPYILLDSCNDNGTMG